MLKSFKGKYPGILLIIGGSLFFSPMSMKADTTTLYVDGSEGGEQSYRRIDKLKTHLGNNQCLIHNISFGKSPDSASNADYVFLPLNKPMPDTFKKILRIKTTNGEALSGSILVKASTGITDLESLDGVLIGFLSPDSLTGYTLPQALFKQAGVVHKQEKITFTDTNFAAITLLLHQDVFASVIATPVAKGWARDNDLHIVASTKTVETGGIWARKNVSSEQITNCKKAFSEINRSEGKYKKLLSIFPYWLDGFVI